jgi:hypothetical protein
MVFGTDSPCLIFLILLFRWKNIICIIGNKTGIRALEVSKNEGFARFKKILNYPSTPENQ